MKKLTSVLLCGLVLLSCKKKTGADPDPIPPTPPPTVIPKDTLPKDPVNPSTVGFFSDRWLEKQFVPPTQTVEKTVTTAATTATVTINTGDVLNKIAPNYYGNNSNLWSGQLPTQSVLVNHLSNFNPGIIRGPAGSVSDIFFFNANNNTPPVDAPAQLVDKDGKKSAAGYWYGKNTDSWTQSIDQYYQLLQLTHATGLLTINYGYARYGTSADPVAAAAHLAAEWVRYDNGRTKYWEIGNECFGDWEAGYRIDPALNKDGQPEIITGALYGGHFKVFADSMRAAANEKGSTIYIGAVVYDSPPASWNTETIKNWNTGVFSNAGSSPDYYIVHSYFTNYYENSSAETIFNTAATVPSAIKNYIVSGMSSAGVPVKPIAMTEWNLFSSGSMQNVSHAAGMHAVLAMNEFIKNGYAASLRWDLANGWSGGDDHGLFSLGDEPDGIAKWTPRPAFYYMYYFQQMIGDRLLSSSVSGDNNIVSIASSFSSGQKGLILVNKNKTAKAIQVNFQYFTPGSKFYYYILTGGTDNAEFSRMVLVNGQGPANNKAGGPADAYTSIKMNSAATTNGIRLELPARSVVYMVVDKR